METLTWIALRACAGLFSGACLYIALVEHPARMRASALAAIAQFRESIPRASVLQPALLVVTLALCGGAYALRPERALLAGAVVLALIVPLTFALLVPINHELLAGEAQDHLERGPALLARWGWLHALRSALALAGTLLLMP